MIPAFVASCIAALVLAAIARASRPAGLLAFLGGWFEWWLIMRPAWLPEKPTGSCVSCTTFWFIGVPVALYGGIACGWGWHALLVPLMVAQLSETLLKK
jgi:hypothetical protein